MSRARLVRKVRPNCSLSLANFPPSAARHLPLALCNRVLRFANALLPSPPPDAVLALLT